MATRLGKQSEETTGRSVLAEIGRTGEIRILTLKSYENFAHRYACCPVKSVASPTLWCRCKPSFYREAFHEIGCRGRIEQASLGYEPNVVPDHLSAIKKKWSGWRILQSQPVDPKSTALLLELHPVVMHTGNDPVVS